MPEIKNVSGVFDFKSASKLGVAIAKSSDYNTFTVEHSFVSNFFGKKIRLAEKYKRI